MLLGSWWWWWCVLWCGEGWDRLVSVMKPQTLPRHACSPTLSSCCSPARSHFFLPLTAVVVTLALTPVVVGLTLHSLSLTAVVTPHSHSSLSFTAGGEGPGPRRLCAHQGVPHGDHAATRAHAQDGPGVLADVGAAAEPPHVHVGAQGAAANRAG